MKKRTVLYAEKGKVLTDGQDFGKQIFLGDGKCEAEYHEITDAEYEAILAARESEVAP